MDELLEMRFKILELSYQYKKDIPQVIADLVSIKIEPKKVKPEKKSKEKSKAVKGKGS
jgi:hypothetical protein